LGAAAYLTHLAGDNVKVHSAGSVPASSVNQIVVQAMLEEGINISDQKPRRLSVKLFRNVILLLRWGAGVFVRFLRGRDMLTGRLEILLGRGLGCEGYKR